MQGFWKPNYSRLLQEPSNGIKLVVTSLDFEKSDSSDKNTESFRMAVPKFRWEGIEAWAEKIPQRVLRKGLKNTNY